MSNHSDIPAEEMGQYHEGMPADWPVMPATPYVGCQSPYFAESLAESGVLISLGIPGSSLRPSEEISYHSQGYYTDEHQYDPLSATVGLGISAPFPDTFPRSLAPSPDIYAPGPTGVQHGMAEAPSQSPQSSPPAKRARHQSSDTSSSNAPINIAPNPEGVLRMARDRQNVQPSPRVLPLARAPNRGRRDPRAEIEDSFVEELRDQKKAWRLVRLAYVERFQKESTAERLQMRLHRRYRERKVRWAKSDIELLLDANRTWAEDKYQYLSDKMKELGSTRWYSADQCRNQLRLLGVEKQHGRMSESPSAISEPAPVTPAPTVSRKRRRAPDP